MLNRKICFVHVRMVPLSIILIFSVLGVEVITETKNQDLRKGDGERRTLELLNQVFWEQRVLEIINSPARLIGQFLQPDPDEQGAADVMRVEYVLSDIDRLRYLLIA